MVAYDPAADPVHGSGWNSAARWGGWVWSEPARGEHFRRCSFCGCIHLEDLAAEVAGDGICRVCGEQGWEACFRSQPLGIGRDEIARLLADPAIPESEKQQLRGEHPAHSYDPGGWYASWADQKYGWPHKFYVEGLKPRDPSLLHCVGSSNSAGHPGGGNWVHANQLTREQKRVIKDDGMHGGGKFNGWYLLEPRGTLHAKFYTAHLADPRIGQDVKDTIQRVSGLRFTFTEDGKVGWQRWEEAALCRPWPRRRTPPPTFSRAARSC